jgi:hypothetical protein
MATNLEHSDHQFVAGAGEYREQFLGVIMQRCSDAGLGIELMPVTVGGRKDPRTVLRGSVTFGRGLKATTPFTLEVYADQQSHNLQVGYQLTTKDVVGGFLANTTFGTMTNGSAEMKQSSPQVQRELTGMMQGFEQIVFLPTLQDLAEAVGVRRPSNGFLGA